MDETTLVRATTQAMVRMPLRLRRRAYFHGPRRPVPSTREFLASFNVMELAMIRCALKYLYGAR